MSMAIIPLLQWNGITMEIVVQGKSMVLTQKILRTNTASQAQACELDNSMETWAKPQVVLKGGIVTET